jgi:hypothetical protein
MMLKIRFLNLREKVLICHHLKCGFTTDGADRFFTPETWKMAGTEKPAEMCRPKESIRGL